MQNCCVMAAQQITKNIVKDVLHVKEENKINKIVVIICPQGGISLYKSSGKILCPYIQTILITNYASQYIALSNLIT